MNKSFLKHPARSVAFVYKKDSIPCSATYLNMSGHNNEATKTLTNLKIMPSDIITNMRADDELGVVDEDLLPNGGMVVELAICQTLTIWEMIHHAKEPLPMYDGLIQLASCNNGKFCVLDDVYVRACESIGDLGIGIKHSASWAYKKLGDKKLLKPDSSVVLPLNFTDTFLPLMKALLRSRIIAKAPLSNASDVRRLSTEQGEGRVRGERI